MSILRLVLRGGFACVNALRKAGALDAVIATVERMADGTVRSAADTATPTAPKTMAGPTEGPPAQAPDAALTAARRLDRMVANAGDCVVLLSDPGKDVLVQFTEVWQLPRSEGAGASAVFTRARLIGLQRGLALADVDNEFEALKLRGSTGVAVTVFFVYSALGEGRGERGCRDSIVCLLFLSFTLTYPHGSIQHALLRRCSEPCFGRARHHAVLPWALLKTHRSRMLASRSRPVHGA